MVLGDSSSTDCFTVPNVSEIASIFPTMEELHSALTGVFKIPAEALSALGQNFPPSGLIPKIPNLPSVPSTECMFGSIQIPSMSAAYSAVGILTGQLLAVLKEMLDKLFTFISRIPFPTIPVFDFDLIKLMAMKPIDLITNIVSKAVAAVKGEIISSIDEVKKDLAEINEAIHGSMELFGQVFDKYSGSIKKYWENLKMSLPPMSAPIFVGFDVPLVESITAVMGAGIAYVGLLIKFAIDQIKRFLKYLDDLEIKYPSFPSLPEVPSFGTILDAVKAKIQQLSSSANEAVNQSIEMVENLKDQITKYGMAELDKFADMFSNAKQNMRLIIEAMRNVNFPQFSFSIPSPIFPTLDKPLMEMVYSYYAMVLQLFSNIVKKLKEYVDRLPLISEVVKWPKIKDWMGTIPSIPSLCGAGINKITQESLTTSKNVVDGYMDSVTSSTSNAIYDMASKAKTTSEAINGTIDSASEGIQESFDSMQDLANSTCSALNQGLGGMSSGLVSEINNLTFDVNDDILPPPSIDDVV